MEAVDKIELKKNVIHHIGMKVDDMLEGAERNVHEAKGGKKALRAHLPNLIKIVGVVDEEVGKSIPDLDTAKLIKSWMSKMIVATENYAHHIESVELHAIGEAAGLKSAIDLLKKMREAEVAKLSSLQAAITSGSVLIDSDGPAMAADGRRLEGIRPSMSIKERRLQEEAAAKATKLTKRRASKRGKAPKRKKASPVTK